ncbi:hypothetical protein E1B28_008231 [Marasmius oreades]|uniref:Uncharacterized protein n=1 Tax=Marasmius oreades TaxID=181124 RepID=A0A9P7RY38_9AGAR|nr:uncharacterized protein E1B28_008231 [Marasmius oreades]KAG7091827.1 hypothetical protein E1B28_008231 [Marasmius oreades]
MGMYRNHEMEPFLRHQNHHHILFSAWLVTSYADEDSKPRRSRVNESRSVTWRTTRLHQAQNQIPIPVFLICNAYYLSAYAAENSTVEQRGVLVKFFILISTMVGSRS